MASTVVVIPLESRNPEPSSGKDHHVGDPPTSFKNPWPSFKDINLFSAFNLKFGNNSEKDFRPVPEGPNGTRSEELVKVRTPDWGVDKKERLRATWIGHASFFVQTPAAQGAERGIRVLFDPVFSERTSPVGWLGPKRYTPTPCRVDELPDVDIVCISHSHYDHLDYYAVLDLYKRGKEKIHFFVPLNNKAWFVKHICPPENVTELDWWDSCQADVEGVGSVRLTCTPSQHASARSGWDKDRTLWSSWALEANGKKLYFSGDTGYQAVDTPSPCPAFVQIGKAFGAFDLAMLPIGLFKPPNFMAAVHSGPEQSLNIHKEINSKLSIGMHYGTVRGGISAQYEDVLEPPRRWRDAAEKEGLWRGGGIEGRGQPIDITKPGVCLCDIGETVAV
ncbi:hypothetical protein LTR37_010183 [Vermiconidia calcicola]|uniref:Uncharacterized protein n=1 Tax=Vermiconidia calcicola TaxID=1690605 RepID=A0ACC3N5H0_9PEZI|nr:hypothetical protein LTR37_010183 [Vermiconidia calcicola]